MSTVAELIFADSFESGARLSRYWQASSLPRIERHKNKPAPPKYRRDRVLKRIMRMNMLAVGRRFNLR